MQTHFRPESEKEHERGSRGYDVPDYCANCRRPYMEHRNGVCPSKSSLHDPAFTAGECQAQCSRCGQSAIVPLRGAVTCPNCGSQMRF